jgi:hypothetical protein
MFSGMSTSEAVLISDETLVIENLVLRKRVAELEEKINALTTIQTQVVPSVSRPEIKGKF